MGTGAGGWGGEDWELVVAVGGNGAFEVAAAVAAAVVATEVVAVAPSAVAGATGRQGRRRGERRCQHAADGRVAVGRCLDPFDWADTG